MPGRCVHQFTPYLAANDAIGREMLLLQRILRGHGYQSTIFTCGGDPVTARSRNDIASYPAAATSDDIVLVHHSTACEAIDQIVNSPAKKVLRYHNITPAEFFEEWDGAAARACRRGRQQLAQLVSAADAFVADSDFNADELKSLGASAVEVVPIIYDFSVLETRPDRALLRRYGDAAANWLFIGRIAPNKAIEDLIKAFAAYRKFYNSRCRLILAGPQRDGELYADACRKLAARLCGPDAVFAREVSPAGLVALYRSAALYFSASRHEGFGVPFVEAMHFRLPIIARDAGAVRRTVGGAGLVYRDADALMLAALADKVIGDRQLQNALATAAAQQLKLYDMDKNAGRLLEIIDNAAK